MISTEITGRESGKFVYRSHILLDKCKLYKQTEVFPVEKMEHSPPNERKQESTIAV